MSLLPTPRYLMRTARDVSRETLYGELVNAALQNLAARDEILYGQTIAELNALGLYTVFSDELLSKIAKAELPKLEYELAFVQNRLAVAGYTNRGSLVDTTPYSARRGEFVRFDGTAGAAQVRLPAANLASSIKHDVSIKLVGGVGPLTVVDAGGATIDGAASAAFPPIAESNLIFSLVKEASPAFLRGGGRIDVTNSKATMIVVIGGSIFTHGVDYSNATNLAAAINVAIPDLEAVVFGVSNIVVVQAREVGRDDAALLLDFGALATSIPGAGWLRADGRELNPTGQFNAAGSDYGGYYETV